MNQSDSVILLNSVIAFGERKMISLFWIWGLHRDFYWKPLMLLMQP